MSLSTGGVASEGNAALAALWMTGAIASFTLMAISGRAVAIDLDTFEVMMYRSLIGGAIVLGFGLGAGRLAEVRTQKFGLHVTRNVFHFTGQNLWFFSVPLVPLAQFAAFEFTTPLWVALAAPFVLGERLQRVQMLGLLVGFAGILIVARPGISPLGIGHLAASIAAIGFAGNVLLTKQLSQTDSVWTILFWMTWTQVAFGLACAGIDGDIALPASSSVKWVLAIGICGLTAHVSLTQALRHAPASVVAPLDFGRLPILAIVGMVLYGEPLEVAVFAGAALILAGNLINLRAGRRRRPA